MWVMTPRGFFSAVADRDVPTRVLVRARNEDDIRNLADLLPDSEPWRLRRSDYEWRLSCTAAEWASVVAQMALEIDYPNFKNAIHARQGSKRANIYTRVWSALLSLEPHGRFAAWWPEPDHEGEEKCAFCGEWRADPDEFHDGLRCIYCAEEDDLDDLDEPDTLPLYEPTKD